MESLFKSNRSSHTHLFEPNSIGLGLAVSTQVEVLVLVKGLRQGAVTTLAKQDQLGMQLHSPAE